MAMQSKYQAFPLHWGTLEGTLTDADISVLPYKVIHCIADTDITISDGTNTKTFAGLTAGDDLILPGGDILVTTTGNVRIS